MPRKKMPSKNAHAAKIVNSVVKEIIVIPFMDDDDAKITSYCNSIGLSGTWVDTSFTGSRRGKYAGIGDTFDLVADVFVPPPAVLPVEEQIV
jgi:hypothetical protein